jgi:hypothetical protein
VLDGVTTGRQNSIRRSPFIVPRRPLAAVRPPLTDPLLRSAARRGKVRADYQSFRGGLDGSRKHWRA